MRELANLPSDNNSGSSSATGTFEQKLCLRLRYTWPLSTNEKEGNSSNAVPNSVCQLEKWKLVTVGCHTFAKWPWNKCQSAWKTGFNGHIYWHHIDKMEGLLATSCLNYAIKQRQGHLSGFYVCLTSPTVYKTEASLIKRLFSPLQTNPRKRCN